MELLMGSATLATSAVGLASLVAMLILVAMCNVCLKPSGNDNTKRKEPKLTEVNSSADKHSSTVQANQSSVHEENEVSSGYKPDSLLRQTSNGSAVRDSKNGDRPTSHDQRALPAIPHAGSGHGLTTDEEEDVDEGHYDVISNRRRKASTPQTTSNTASPSRQNLYEKVDDMDPTYAGIKSDSSDPGYAGVGPGTTSGASTATGGVTDGIVAGGARGNHPYAVVNGIGASGYAHIADKTPSPNPRLSVVQALGMAPQASVETLDSYTSGPPIPDKNFPVSDSEIELSAAAAAATAGAASAQGVTVPPKPTAQSPPILQPVPPIGTSPSLPPRNSDRNSNIMDVSLTGSMIGGSDTSSSNQGSSSSPSSPPVHVLPSDVSIATPGGGTDTVDGAPAGKKKGPDYSSVTARESLANIRERQAAEMRANLPPDAMYETVNYDAVKVPKSSSENDRGQRNSLTSDLYAEIASASGENSTRSSMYARVGDVHAPTPPPVHLLRNMSSATSPDDEPDPGYSMIRRTRPQSAFPGAMVANDNNNQQEASSPDDGSAIYAVIDKAKTRRNRTTVHVTENVLENELDMTSNQVYAQVNKLGNKEIVYDNPIVGLRGEGAFNNNQGGVGGGARPKARTQSSNDNGYSNNAELKRKMAQGSSFKHWGVEDPYASIKERDEDPYAKVKDVDPYSKVKDVDPYSKVRDVDPYAQIRETVTDPKNPYSKVKDVDPYSKVKDPPYSKVKDVEPPYAKVKDSDSAGYSRIKDVNSLVKGGNGSGGSSSEEVAGYSSIRDVLPTGDGDGITRGVLSSGGGASGGNDPNYAVIPGDGVVMTSQVRNISGGVVGTSSSDVLDPNYDSIATFPDNVSMLRVAPHGYATEISGDDAAAVGAASGDVVADGNNNPNNGSGSSNGGTGLIHIAQHQGNRDLWSRREHLYEEITVGEGQSPGFMYQGQGHPPFHHQGDPGSLQAQQVTVHHRPPGLNPQQYNVHRLSTDL